MPEIVSVFESYVRPSGNPRTSFVLFSEPSTLILIGLIASSEFTVWLSICSIVKSLCSFGSAVVLSPEAFESDVFSSVVESSAVSVESFVFSSVGKFSVDSSVGISTEFGTSVSFDVSIFLFESVFVVISVLWLSSFNAFDSSAFTILGVLK